MADTLPAVDPIPARRATDLPADAPWWAKWLEANVHEAWKWASVRWSALCFAVAEVYAMDPGGFKQFVHDHIPATWWPHLVGGAFLATAAFRIVRIAKLKFNQETSK